MAVEILITGDYRDRDIKRAQHDLDLLKNQSGMTGAAFTKMAGFAAGMGAAVGTAAIQAIQAGAQMAVTFGVDGVKAFLDDEAGAAKLARTLKNLGLEGATAAVEANIDSLQRQTGVVDDILRPSFDRLVRSVGNVGEANKLLGLSLDVSAGTGRSLESVVQALGKAYDGNTGGLSRLGAGLDKATLKTGDMDLITQKLADTFGGQAAVKAATFQGQLDRVSVAFSELKESFGRGFMAGVVAGFDDGRNAGDRLADTIKTLEPTFYDLGTTIGSVVQYIPTFVSGLKVIINGMTVVRESTYLAVKGLIAASQAMTGDFAGAAKTITDGAERVKFSFGAMLEAGANVAGLTFNPLRTAMSGTVSGAIAAGNALGGTGGGGGGGGGTSLAGGAAAAADKTVILTDKQKNLAETMAGTQVAVKQATDELAALTKASDEYAASITGAIKGTIDLSTAFSAAQKASQEGTLAAGETVVSTTIANFQAQILAAKQFADSLIAVSNAGGSQALIDQILKVAGEQGPGAGEFLANSLVAEGVVPTLTADLAAFDVFAGEAGTALSDKFYAQGITSAVALLAGLSKEVSAQKAGLTRLGLNIGQPIADAIAEEIAKAVREGVADGKVAAARRRAEAATAVFVAQTIAPSTAVAGGSFTGGGMVNLPGLAVGGPATAGRPYLVGEKGPELFVPGSNGNVVPNNAMGGNSYTINVNAGVGDPRAIGQQIVEYVKKFEQANGPVFRAA
jgi:hypothetical protein